MKDTLDNLEDITLEQLKRKYQALQRENHAAFKTIDKLLKDISKKNEEIQELQRLLSASVPAIQPEEKKVKLEITSEEEIAVFQLERLRQAAKIRSLTLEETRMYDLLVKNKRLATGESTINLPKGGYRDVNEIELLKIAESSKPDEQDKS